MWFSQNFSQLNAARPKSALGLTSLLSNMCLSYQPLKIWRGFFLKLSQEFLPWVQEGYSHPWNKLFHDIINDTEFPKPHFKVGQHAAKFLSATKLVPSMGSITQTEPWPTPARKQPSSAQIKSSDRLCPYLPTKRSWTSLSKSYYRRWRLSASTCNLFSCEPKYSQ